MQDSSFDVVIVGGGMVGAALACGLAQHGFHVAVLEREEPPDFIADSEPDMRISAISCASVALLKQLEVWPAVQAMRCAAYRSLETWEWHSAQVVFEAASLGLPELGYMVENSVLQRALWQRMQQLPVTLICPASLQHLRQSGSGWSIELEDGRQVAARLVVGADGARSRVRQLAQIGVRGWHYAQSCMLISVACEREAGDRTWQQFTPQGPRAFLPLWENRASLVWYDHPARIRQLQGLSMPQLEQAVRQTFPSRLGHFNAQQAGAFPLTRRHAIRYVLPGLALVGDAAHTINPLAGQGVNLGYRDVDLLLDTLIKGRNNGGQWWSESSLLGYQRTRRRDNLLMQSGMDLFYLAFSNDLPPVKLLRNLGLMAAQNAGALKRQALRYALGLS